MDNSQQAETTTQPTTTQQAQNNGQPTALGQISVQGKQLMESSNLIARRLFGER